MSRDSRPRGDDGAVAAVLLAALVRDGDPDPAGEERAVAAFRAAREARDAGGDRVAVRRRRRWCGLRAGALAGAVTVLLGGVAVAAQTGAIRAPFTGGDGGGAVTPGPAPTAVTSPSSPYRTPGGGGEPPARENERAGSGKKDPSGAAPSPTRRSARPDQPEQEDRRQNRDGQKDRTKEAGGKDSRKGHSRERDGQRDGERDKGRDKGRDDDRDDGRDKDKGRGHEKGRESREKEHSRRS
ncbi:hypothetical protein [Streptomyces sp. NPDC015131]|uniref:hypothetical protein n=1 Tax=Streptomyces sp. NPDC015131 TaxID=3364941 RepID=UPI0037035FFA